MTDEPTNKQSGNTEIDSTDKEFELNHFDVAGDSDRKKTTVAKDVKASDANDLFADATQIEKSEEKKEPRIPTITEMETPDKHPDAKNEHATKPASDPVDQKYSRTAPPTSKQKSPPVEPSSEQSSRTKPITVFAILAMLVAAIAVWLNPGITHNSADNPASETQSVLAKDIQIQRLESRISALEQRGDQQREEQNQRLEQLQQQISHLTSQLANQTKKQPPQRKTKTVQAKPDKYHISTSPVTSRPISGWVVNLVSVNSRYAANKALARYKDLGISAEIYPAIVKGKTWYRIRISGFPSKKEATAKKDSLSADHGIKDAWVQKP